MKTSKTYRYTPIDWLRLIYLHNESIYNWNFRNDHFENIESSSAYWLRQRVSPQTVAWFIVANIERNAVNIYFIFSTFDESKRIAGTTADVFAHERISRENLFRFYYSIITINEMGLGLRARAGNSIFSLSRVFADARFLVIFLFPSLPIIPVISICSPSSNCRNEWMMYVA